MRDRFELHEGKYEDLSMHSGSGDAAFLCFFTARYSIKEN